MSRLARAASAALVSVLMSGPAAAAADAPAGAPAGLADAAAEAKKALLAKHPAEGARIERGVDQVAQLWRAGDGDAAAFRAFVEKEFLPAGETFEGTFQRLESASERLGGYYTSLARDLRAPLDVD